MTRKGRGATRLSPFSCGLQRIAGAGVPLQNPARQPRARYGRVRTDLTRRTPWQNPIHKTTTAFYERSSKRRKGFPSETRVKRGERVVHGDKELSEKLGRNDPCPCGSTFKFQELLPAHRRLRRLAARPLLLGSDRRRHPWLESLAPVRWLGHLARVSPSHISGPDSSTHSIRKVPPFRFVREGDSCAGATAHSVSPPGFSQ